MTTGEAGMRAQALGLAGRLGGAVIEKRVGLAPPWRWLPPNHVPNSLRHLNPALDALSPPWPDLLVSCGRRAAPLAAAVRRKSGGLSLAVHIQDPRMSPSAFDLVVALGHDDLEEGPGVIKTLTAMHAITPAALSRARRDWAERLAGLPRPLTGVAIGGPTRRSPFGPRQVERLTAGLKTRRATGEGLAITPSRRTPPAAAKMLVKAFGDDDGVFLWRGGGDNPYLAILALCDRLVVTGDSVSMVSEAIAAGPPVEVFETGEGRHQAFLSALLERGLVHRFGQSVEDPTAGRSQACDSTAEAAAAVLRLLQARTG
ncbi:MAG: mitochondrial fission ELM1 family protein [Caulobacteraceae bacterium]